MGKATEALRRAAAKGKTDAVKSLLDAGVNVDAVNEHGDTALHYAVYYKKTETVNLLLKSNADANVKNKEGWTSLHVAICNEQPETVESLIEYGADIYVGNDSEEKATKLLHRAAEEGMNDAVKLLLDVGVSIDSVDEAGYTALHRAVCYGQTGMVNLLLRNCADVNTKNNEGRTPLHTAISYEQAKTARSLINRGADIYIEDDSGETVLNLAGHAGSERIRELFMLTQSEFINDKGKHSLAILHYAAEDNNLDEINLLLNSGVNVNTVNNEGKTALHSAAHFGHTQAIKILLDAGADIGAVDSEGEMALHSAAYLGYVQAVKVLLNKCSDVDVQDKDGWTALHHAALSGQNEMVELLLNEGADVDAKNDVGDTALVLAKKKDFTETVKVLQANSTRSNQTQEQTRIQTQESFPKHAMLNVFGDRSSDDFVAIDVETTGFSGSDKIVDLAAIRFRGGKEVDSFSELINPKIPIPPQATKVNGITNSAVSDAPVIEDIFYGFIEFISDDLIVAHNANFDMRFLNKTAGDICNTVIKNKVECTYRLAKDLVRDVDSHKLGTLVNHFNIPVDPVHRAYPDALAAGHLYLILLSKM